MKSFAQFFLEMSIYDAMQVFGLPHLGIDPESLKQRWKQLAKQHHPDMGGSQNDFIRAKNAYDILQRATGTDSHHFRYTAPGAAPQSKPQPTPPPQPRPQPQATRPNPGTQPNAQKNQGTPNLEEAEEIANQIVESFIAMIRVLNSHRPNWQEVRELAFDLFRKDSSGFDSNCLLMMLKDSVKAAYGGKIPDEPRILMSTLLGNMDDFTGRWLDGTMKKADVQQQLRKLYSILESFMKKSGVRSY